MGGAQQVFVHPSGGLAALGDGQTMSGLAAAHVAGGEDAGL